VSVSRVIHSSPKLNRVGGKVVAVIEDELTIATAVADRLRKENLSVEIATDGPSGVDLCSRLKPDLVILDVMLPGLDGLEVCRRIQKERAVPVLMLTARDTETDMLVGLGVGADDYMTKPFSVRELVARVHAILRRVDRASTETEKLEVGNVGIDLSARRVRVDGNEVHLTPIEFELLVLLTRNPETVYTRGQLLSQVWGFTNSWSERTVDSHIAALRRKLGSDIVRTVHGIGYSLGAAP
jgi:DNA-binding response OmpR family regulator